MSIFQLIAAFGLGVSGGVACFAAAQAVRELVRARKQEES